MVALSATRGQALLWLRCHLALQTNTFVVRGIEGGGDVWSIPQEGRRFLFLPYVFGNHAAPNQCVQLPPVTSFSIECRRYLKCSCNIKPPLTYRTQIFPTAYDSSFSQWRKRGGISALHGWAPCTVSHGP